jgi:hypothetical protein
MVLQQGRDDLGRFQAELEANGEYDSLGARPDDPVAFKPNVYEQTYVLGKVSEEV